MNLLNQEVILRRLAIIKYLYEMGVCQSNQVETIAGFSILAFHDSAEMFLLLIAENKGDAAPRNFMEYWDRYKELTLKESMKRLKDIRVDIKHRGQFPSKSDINICRITIGEFFEQNTIAQFGLEFKDISITEIISYKNVKEYVNIAVKCCAENKTYDSLVNIKIAFMELLSTYESNKREPYWIGSLLSVGNKIGNDYRKLVTENRDGVRWFQQVTETVNKIREILKITALGIDYKKYTYFMAATPDVQKWFDKNSGSQYSEIPKEYFEQSHCVSGDDCKRCIDFVIDSAIKLQNFDYSIDNILNK